MNAKIERLLLSVNSVVNNLIKRNVDFTATTVKEMMLGSVNGLVYDAAGTGNDQSGRVETYTGQSYLISGENGIKM